MDLRDVALYFDRDRVFDAYTGDYLFDAQFASFDGSAPDGSFRRRRTVSYAPSIMLPVRRAVRVLTEVWVLGDPITDGFDGEAIRKTCSARYATAQYSLLTPLQAIVAPAIARMAYGHAQYLKSTADSQTTSDYDPAYTVSFGKSEVGLEKLFLYDGQYVMHVRSAYADSDGFQVCEADALGLLQDAQVQVYIEGEIDPVTEEPEPSVAWQGLVFDRYKLYIHNTQADPLNKAGDLTLLLPMTAVLPSNRLSLWGRPWEILSSLDYADVRLHHIRRTGA